MFHLQGRRRGDQKLAHPLKRALTLASDDPLDFSLAHPDRDGIADRERRRFLHPVSELGSERGNIRLALRELRRDLRELRRGVRELRLETTAVTLATHPPSSQTSH